MPREGQREVHEQEDVARGQPGAGAQRGRGAQAAGLHQQEGGRHRRRGDQGGPGDGGQGALCGVQIKLVGGGEFRNQGDGGEGGPETRKNENVTGKYIASNINLQNTVFPALRSAMSTCTTSCGWRRAPRPPTTGRCGTPRPSTPARCWSSGSRTIGRKLFPMSDNQLFVI